MRHFIKLLLIITLMAGIQDLSWAVSNQYTPSTETQQNIQSLPYLRGIISPGGEVPGGFDNLKADFRFIQSTFAGAGLAAAFGGKLTCAGTDYLEDQLSVLHEMEDFFEAFFDDSDFFDFPVRSDVGKFYDELVDYIDNAEDFLDACGKRRPSIQIGLGNFYLLPCKKPSSFLMGYNPNGTHMDGLSNGANTFPWVNRIQYEFSDGALITGFAPGVSSQGFNDMVRSGSKINCNQIQRNAWGLSDSPLFIEWYWTRQIQEEGDSVQIAPNDRYYKFEASTGKKAVRGLMKGLGALQGFGGGGGFTLGGGGSSKKGTADDQWGLWKVGYTPMDSPSSAWQIETGEGKPVVVAVIDSGLDITHPDLSLDNLWRNEGEIPGNFIDDDGNGYIDDTFGWNFIDWNNAPFDDNGHGTFVTGIIAAKSNNGMGIAGINQGVIIMPIKATNDMGHSNNFDIYRAIVYAVDNGASIINISIGGSRLSRLEQIAVDYAYDNGVLVVVAVGNQGTELVDYGPAGSQKVLAVAALDVSGRKRGSSNYGPTVAITAPGEEIISLRARETDFLRRLGGGSGILGEDRLYYKSTGSSFAAPFVTGTASLLKAKDADMTNSQMEGVLMGSALDIEEPGLDVLSGAGLLNARGAMSAQKDQILTARITKIEKVEEGKKVVSYKIYGVASGGLFKDYSLSVGKGKIPKKWSSVSLPFTEAKDYDLLGTIDSNSMKGFGTWNVRLTVNGTNDEIKEVYLPVPKK